MVEWDIHVCMINVLVSRSRLNPRVLQYTPTQDRAQGIES